MRWKDVASRTPERDQKIESCANLRNPSDASGLWSIELVDGFPSPPEVEI